MNNTVTLIVIGVYTVVYVVVFLIQKSQIEKSKEVVNAMKSFIDIFKVDEVIKYSDMRIETFKMQLDVMLKDDDKINEMVENVKKETAGPIQKLYAEIMAEKYVELVNVVLKVAMNQKPENREDFIKDLMPNNSEYLIPLLKEIENKNP